MSSPEPLSNRQRRAIALIASAAIVILAAAVLYLRLSTPSQPRIEGATAIDRSIVSSGPITYDFVTPSIGWAAMNPVGPSTTIAIFKTTDAGKQWRLQLVVQTAPTISVPFQLQFIDQDRGFVAAGGAIGNFYRTVDGGATWASVPLPGNATQVDGMAFIDSSHGWLLLSSNVTALYGTDDAGSTWKRINLPGDAFGLGARGPAEVWVGSFVTGFPHVYSSSNAGRNWQRHDLPPPRGTNWDAGNTGGAALLIQTAIQLLPEAGAVALVEPDSATRYTFKTLDGGATWTYVLSPPGIVGYEDTSHWWAMKGTSLFKSSDAGTTWTRVTSSLPDWQFKPQILDSRHAWATLTVFGGYGLATTSDGGAHWTRAQVPRTD